MDISVIVRPLALAIMLSVVSGARAQGIEEHVHRFKVDGISSTMLEKQCHEALLAFDPEMVVSIDRQYRSVKVKTMHELPLAQLVGAMQQLGLTATIDLTTNTGNVKEQP